MKRTIKENKFFILDRAIQFDIVSLLKHVFRYLIKAPYYRLVLLASTISFHRKHHIRKKYRVSICAVFKDEAEILKEWVEYHLIVGVEHFYLYNNNSSDGFMEILTPYINRGVITLIDWPMQQGQLAAYNDAINRYSHETKWMGFIDLDEFVVPKKADTVYDFLKQFDSKAGAVLIYWRVFGSSGIVKRDKTKLFTEQFTLSFPKWNDIGKCFYNTDFEFGGDLSWKNNMLHHWCWCKHGKLFIPPVNPENRVTFPKRNIIRHEQLPIQINHYVTKSYEDYYYKAMMKTDVYFKDNPRTMSQFYRIDQKCIRQDYIIFRYMVRLKQAIKGECDGQL